MRRGRVWLRDLPTVSLCLCLCGAAASQSRSPGTQSNPLPASSGNRVGLPSPTWQSDPVAELNPNIVHRQRDARRDELKKQLMANAARLLELTRQLQASLQERPATPEDGKRLDEIARLARSVRDGMRQ